MGLWLLSQKCNYQLLLEKVRTGMWKETNVWLFAMEIRTVGFFCDELIC